MNYWRIMTKYMFIPVTCQTPRLKWASHGHNQRINYQMIPSVNLFIIHMTEQIQLNTPEPEGFINCLRKPTLIVSAMVVL